MTPLERARDYFEYANAHPVITTWRTKAREDYGFYDGDGQWEESVLWELHQRNQAAVTINKIKPLVDFLSGVEIQTRFQFAFRSHSGREQDDRLAKALTHLGYFIQEDQNIPYQSSLKFRDCLITGIGWSQLYKDHHGITYESVHPFNVVFDPDDLSPNLENMQFVGRMRWLPVEEAKRLWPKEKAYFESLFAQAPQVGSSTGELGMRQSTAVDMYTSGDGGTGSRVLVVEVQYKDYKDAYQGFDQQGLMFETFSKQMAWELDPKGSFQKIPAAQIQRVLYTGDCLLESGPLRPVIPNLPDFTYMPVVWSRRTSDGVPNGWIAGMKDVQREMNYRRAKLINNLSSFRAEVDADALPGLTVEQIRDELKRPDSVLIKTPNSLLNIQSNMPLAQGQFEMLMQADRELQQVSGIHDDALGKPTNAESGVAIEKRQVNSVESQRFAFDNLKYAKKREACLLLSYLQGGGDTFMEVQILDDEEQESILLNVVRMINGQRIVLNDVRTLPLGVYVEETQNKSTAEEQQANLIALLGNAHAPLIMKSPKFMKRLGIRDYEELANEMQAIMQQELVQQAQLDQPAAQGTA